MLLEIKKVNLPWNKVGTKCPYGLKPTGVIAHNTYNDASAMSEISYMQNNWMATSFHFAVDDVRAVQGLELDRNAWHAGDGVNGYANRNLLAVEICYSKSGGEKFRRAEENGALLIAMLCMQYGWGVDRIFKHSSFTATECPHRTAALGWDRFLKMVQKKLDELKGVVEQEKPIKGAYLARVTPSALNIRQGAGTNTPIVGVIRDKGVYTIVDEKSGFGRLKSGAGWVSLDYMQKTG